MTTTTTDFIAYINLKTTTTICPDLSNDTKDLLVKFLTHFQKQDLQAFIFHTCQVIEATSRLNRSEMKNLLTWYCYYNTDVFLHYLNKLETKTNDHLQKVEKRRLEVLSDLEDRLLEETSTLDSSSNEYKLINYHYYRRSKEENDGWLDSIKSIKKYKDEITTLYHTINYNLQIKHTREGK